MAQYTRHQLAEMFFNQNRDREDVLPVVHTDESTISQPTTHWLAQTVIKRGYRQWKFWISVKQASWLFKTARFEGDEIVYNGYYTGQFTTGHMPESGYLFELKEAKSNGAAIMTVTTPMWVEEATTYLYPIDLFRD